MARKNNIITKTIEKLRGSSNNTATFNSKETDSTNKDIVAAKSEIVEAFTHFLADYQNQRLDYLDLSESQLAILGAVRFNFGIQTEEGELYLVKSVSRQRVHVVTHSIDDFISNKKSSEVSIVNGVTTIYSWDDLPKIDFNYEDIDVKKALMNLSELTALSFRIPSEYERTQIINSLIPNIHELMKLISEGMNLDDYQSTAPEHDITTKNAV